MIARKDEAGERSPITSNRSRQGTVANEIGGKKRGKGRRGVCGGMSRAGPCMHVSWKTIDNINIFRNCGGPVLLLRQPLSNTSGFVDMKRILILGVCC